MAAHARLKNEFTEGDKCHNLMSRLIRIWAAYVQQSTVEPPHDKTSNVAVRPAKTRISLGIRPVCSESSLSACRKLGSLATHWAHSEDWSVWADAQADLSLRWAHTHFVGFVMRRVSYLRLQYPKPMHTSPLWVICDCEIWNGSVCNFKLYNVEYLTILGIWQYWVSTD